MNFKKALDNKVADAATYKDHKFYAYDIDSSAERKYYEELLGDIENTLREYVSPDITILDDTDAEHITVSFKGELYNPYNKYDYSEQAQRIMNWMDKYGFILDGYRKQGETALLEFGVDPDQFNDEVFED